MLKDTYCTCQSARCPDRNTLLEDFQTLRENCPALRKVLVPDDIWPDFERIVQAGFDEARHWPITLKALHHGYIGRITTPLHRYLIDGNKVVSQLKPQYRKDLAEKWISGKTYLERHKKSRIFQGKLAELLAATWIENQRWTIGGLEALGAEFDIEAKSPDNLLSSIEVKYIGHEDIRFEEMVADLSFGNVVARSWNVYDGHNFILFKAYEAAKQLVSSDRERIAFIIISNMAWDFLEVPIIDNWICKRPFTFSNSASPQWKEFLMKKKDERRFSSIESDLDYTLGQIKGFWIIKEENYLNYSLQSIIQIK